MIVSYSHGYIYIRPKKTGSSTIEAVLSPSLGPHDLIAGKRSAHVKKQLGGQNTDLLDSLSAHIKAKKIKALVPPEFWETAYKFASERHPYEKAVSLAYYRLGKKGLAEEEFAVQLEKAVQSGEYRSFDYYTLNGRIVVDDFVRQETFHTDLKRVGARIGVAIPEELPRKKGSHRLDKRPAREILSEDQRKHVFEICREEFELFGYEP